MRPVFGKFVADNSFVHSGIYILALSIILLWPFDLHSLGLVSEVAWISPNNGVEIQAVSGLRSVPFPMKLYNRLVGGEGVTVEAWVVPRDVAQDGPARIVSYSLDLGSRNFTLGQSGRALVMRLRTTRTDLNGRDLNSHMHAMRVPEVFVSNLLHHLVVTYDHERGRVYVNGEQRLEKFGPGGTFANWDQSFPFLMGNEATGDRPWLGRIFLVAIYDRALSAPEAEKNFHAGHIMDSVSEQASGRVTTGLVALL